MKVIINNFSKIVYLITIIILIMNTAGLEGKEGVATLTETIYPWEYCPFLTPKHRKKSEIRLSEFGYFIEHELKIRKVILIIKY